MAFTLFLEQSIPSNEVRLCLYLWGRLDWASPFTLNTPFPPKMNQVPRSCYSEHTPNSPPNSQGTMERDVTKQDGFLQ